MPLWWILAGITLSGFLFTCFGNEHTLSPVCESGSRSFSVFVEEKFMKSWNCTVFKKRPVFLLQTILRIFAYSLSALGVAWNV